MIQELLGSPALIGRERKLSMNINGGGLIFEGTPHSLSSPSLSPSPSPSPSTPNISPPVAAAAVAAPTATTTTTTSTTNSSNPENLRCPRCDSSNTKFCYYNNYNLTQPRHFCKTCRRYWTKGGALRNVPIGGGCRKNKNSTVSSSVAKSSAAKFKNLSTEIGRSGLIGGFNHELPANPVLWASPQGSHILALLRASQNPNPNPSSQNPHLVTLKEEKNLIGTHLMPEPGIANSAMSARNLGIMDPLVHLPSWTSLLRNNPQQQVPHQICHQQQSGIILGGDQVQNSGMQSLYLRLRASSTGNYNTYSEQSPEILGNVAASSSSPSSTSILESVPAPMSELGYWNPAFCLSDLPTTNSAYP